MTKRSPKAEHSPPDLWAPPKQEKQKRKCLRCDVTFWARGRFERLCPTCRTYADKNDDGQDW